MVFFLFVFIRAADCHDGGEVVVGGGARVYSVALDCKSVFKRHLCVCCCCNLYLLSHSPFSFLCLLFLRKNLKIKSGNSVEKNKMGFIRAVGVANNGSRTCTQKHYLAVASGTGSQRIRVSIASDVLPLHPSASSDYYNKRAGKWNLSKIKKDIFYIIV